MSVENTEDDENLKRLRKSRKLGLCQKLSNQYKACYLEGQTPFDRAQKFDGGYFEKFNSIDWKEIGEQNAKHTDESKQIEELPEPKDLEKIEEGSGNAEEVLSDGKSSILSDKQKEALYCEALYTIIHQVGAKGSSSHPSNGELYVYLQEVMKFSQEKHKELYSKTKNREAPRIYLKVEVIEARDLEAKDANGLSDPYCMIGLMSSDMEAIEETKKPRKRKKSVTLREILKNEAIQMTTVRENTLNPTWNETFTMEVNNVFSDILHIDIWDCDDKTMLADEDNKVTKIKGFHGVGRYFKDVVQSARANDNESTDDFLGYLEYRIKDIPSDGIDEWVTLKTKSSKCRVSGECHVKVSLSSGDRPDLPQEILSLYPTFSDVYGALLHEFAAYDLEQAKMMLDKQKWEGQLSDHAHYILHQLAIQNDLTPLQETAMRWRFYSQLHWENPIQYDTLCSLAQNLTKHWKPGKLSEREDRALLKNLRLFVNNCLQLLIKHRDLYPPTDSTRFGRLVSLVECLQTVCEMDVYQEDDHEPLPQTLAKIVKESASIWYNKMHAWNEPQESSFDAKLSSIIQLAECVLTDFLKGLKFYNKVFALVGVNYFSVTYCQLELMLANDVRLFMESVKQSIKGTDQQDIVGEKLFALYLAVRELMTYREHTNTSDNQVYGFDDHHLWFKTAVVRWLDIAQNKAKDRIAKAVDIDNFLRVDSSVVHSTSAVDGAGCFHQILEFWKKLDWPDAVGSYMFITQIINIICDNASYYADLVFEKMIKEDYYGYSDPTQFDVSEQLCVTLNDIEYMRLWLANLPVRLGMDQVVSAMTKVHGEKSGRHAQTSMDTVLSSADEDMLNKIAKIIEHIGQKMAVDIKKFVIQLSWEQNPKPAAEAIGPLLQYLDDDLMVLNKSLMKSVFQQILEFIWEVVVEAFSNMMKSSRGNPPEFYFRLKESIEIVKMFFYADGVGLSNEQLSGGLYKSIQETLTIRCMSSRELIQMYYVDMCERQDKSTEKYGAITIRALYDNANGKLLVEVLNAQNLVALDTNGLSDPYVLLRLQPNHIFGRDERKTKVVKNTLFPLFDEKFSFSITPEQCKIKGACLSMTVLDYDVISNDDIEGQAFLPLHILAGLDSPIQGGFANEPQITLNLMHPTPDGLAFEILECRKDKEAEAFVKNEKLTYEKTCSAHS